MEKILIIDDDRSIYRTFSGLITRMGSEAVWAQTLVEGMSEVKQDNYDVVLLDVHLPDGCGQDIVSRIRRAPSQPEVIIMTGFGNVDGAAIAIKNGAWDYIQKAGSPQEITLSLKRVLEYRREQGSHRSSAVALNLKGIVGESASLKSCYDQVARAASGEANVLISGETGTGKEIFVRAIHTNSSRAGASLVVVDCAALPETLVESLLFGREKGVYTGADKSRPGLIAQADGGTLFLDEVGELSANIQKVLLRVLQERKYRPVGGQRELPSNFRLVAATNRNLDQMVDAGRFRKDLLYRIRTIEITLPPLRERADDVMLLALHYLSKICDRHGVENKAISPDFMAALKHYPWPGNIRELINAMETAVSNAGPESTLYARHLPPDIRLRVIQSTLDKAPTSIPRQDRPPLDNGVTFAQLTDFKAFRKAAISKVEKEYLRTLLDQTQNDLDKSLDFSGLSRSRFYDLLKQHDLSL
jgi:two-component system NtrC family response regulator